MKREVAKNEIRRRASKLVGMFIAVSFTVSSRNKRWIYNESVYEFKVDKYLA